MQENDTQTTASRKSTAATRWRKSPNLFGIHRNTVREWVKRGLPTSDDRRPMLILGRDLAAFLQARRAKNKRPASRGKSIASAAAPRNRRPATWRTIHP